MDTKRRNRCDEIIALIDRCLADYEAGFSEDIAAPRRASEARPLAA